MRDSNTTTVSKPYLRFVGAKEVEEKREQSAKKTAKVEIINSLSAHIDRSYQSARHFRERSMSTGSSLSQRYMDSKRQRDGEYEADILGLIRDGGGNDQFFNITDTKCAGAEAWMRDVITPQGDKAWTLEATPIPDLSDQDVEEIGREIRDKILEYGITDPDVAGEIAERIGEIALEEKQATAKRKAQRMEELISDQMVEGGFYDALSDFRRYITTFPIGVMKGPVIRLRKRMEWNGNTPVVIDAEVPTWEAPNPQDIFFGPNARNIDETYIIERIRWSKASLSSMRGQQGYDAKAIAAVLAEGSAKEAPTTTDFERASSESRDTTINQGLSEDTLEGLEFWGSVEGSLLMEWGLPGVEDPFKYYEIQAIKFGNHVIKATLNPDPLGRHPYYVTSYEKLPGNLYGVSIPEKMRDCQRGYNAALRNLVDNAAIGAGPMAAINVSALAADQDIKNIYPRMIVSFEDSMSVHAGRNPVTFFQPNIVANELMSIAEMFKSESDDRTLIPRYQIGSTDVGQVGETASGMSMLMNAAAKGIKQVISNIDSDVLTPCIERIYHWNMVHHGDDAVKGDCRVVPKGYLARIVREQLQGKRQEWLALTNNPTDMQIIGIEGRRKVLEATTADIEVDNVVPGEMDLAPMPDQEMGVEHGANTAADDSGDETGVNRFGGTRDPDDGRMVTTEYR